MEKASKKIQLQRASRMASRGANSTLFHLLFPITLILSFTLFYFLPLIAVGFVEQSGLAEFIRIYLKGSVLVVAAATLITYHKARKRMLAPYLKQVSDQVSESGKDS